MFKDKICIASVAHLKSSLARVLVIGKMVGGVCVTESVTKPARHSVQMVEFVKMAYGLTSNDGLAYGFGFLYCGPIAQLVRAGDS